MCPALLLPRHRRHLVNSRTSAGFTPLHFAAARGHVGVVKLLLSHSADFSLAITQICWSVEGMAQFDVSSTALHMAARIGDAATVDVILYRYVSPASVDMILHKYARPASAREMLL